MPRPIGAAAALGFVVLCAATPVLVGFGSLVDAWSGEPPVAPPAPPVPPVVSKPPVDPGEAAIDAERSANVAAYEEGIAGWRERYVHESLGRWIVIAGGTVFPSDGHRTRPAESMEAALAFAEREVPEARHRFVFRLGEEGDVRSSTGGTELTEVFGTAMLAEFETLGLVPADGWLTPPEFTHSDGRKVALRTKGPDPRPYVRPVVGAPGESGVASWDFCLATGTTAFGTVSATLGAALRLARFEIPGVHHLQGVFGSGAARRARLRVRFPDTTIDLVVPIAVRR